MHKINDKFGRFTFTKVLKIEELDCMLYELEHECGAKILQLANDDKENSFSLLFQTLPSSDNGVAHILEHTVLCGSKKYPVKDPFFAMTRRSLNTFMNAMTGSDFTCYPAASQVEKDLYNLLDVYIDAVFFPTLNRYSFLQEGHRLEFKKQKDPSSELLFKGIVYNEMKGSLSSPDTRLWHAINKHLLPDLPYAFNSGGDPKEIPDLTYGEFCTFHETYYHPSRCLFYFYGDIPIETHLTYLEERLLKDTEKKPPLPPIPLQKRFKEPKRILTSYPFSGEKTSHRTYISFSFLTSHVTNQEDVMALCLLDSILMDTDASLLKAALLKTGLAREVDAYIDIEMSEIPYIIVCKGCEEKDADALEKALFDAFKEIIKNGIDKHLIDSSLHQLELSRSEITGGQQPFGLNLFFRCAFAKLHGCPVENALLFHSLFEKLLSLTSDPKYLPSILEKYFVKNQHFVRLVMKPDSHVMQEEKASEEKLLSCIKKGLNKEEQDKIIEDSLNLAKFQKDCEKQNINCLPKIALSEIPKKNMYFDLKVQKKKSFTLYSHDCFTNHIVYSNLVFPLPLLSEEELMYTKLLTFIFAELGTKDRPYEHTLEFMHAHTGGIGAYLATYPQLGSTSLMKPAFHVKGKALKRNTKHLFQMMIDLISSLRMDEKDRVQELLLQLSTLLQNKLTSHSMSYANSLSVCNNSKVCQLQEMWNGLSYYNFVQNLVKDLKTNLPKILEKLTSLKEKLFYNHNFDVVVSSSKEELALLEKENFFGLEDLKQKPYTPFESSFSLPHVMPQARSISSPVAFISKGFKTITQPDKDAPLLSIASVLMENKVLHKEIREVGGAYGAGAYYGGLQGNFYMHSYRDPHIADTLKTFDKAIEEIKLKKFDEDDLEEAKLTIVQGLDSPVPPGARAMTTYVQLRENRDKETRQAYRDALLNADSSSVQKAVEKHLTHFAKEATTVVFCEKPLAEKENAQLDKKLTLLAIED